MNYPTSNRGRILQENQIDMFTLKIALGFMNIETLKQYAQTVYDQMEWYGTNDQTGKIYQSCIEVIRKTEPHFEVKYTPAQ